jgi:exopolyphosphatase/guanosine-5'-triphosphate,3'-diphosphate pyrophosphatase
LQRRAALLWCRQRCFGGRLARTHATPPAQRNPLVGDDLSTGARATPLDGSVGPAPAPSIPPDRREDQPRRGLPVYAALDLGTNNCRLLVAVPDRAGFRVVDAFSRIVRLGEGLSRSGVLSDLAQERAFSALAVCRDKLAENGVTRSRLIATEACRAAGNGAAFVGRVRAELGLDIELVDRETEAHLAVRGCEPLLDPEAHAALVFDIGGGSTELAFIADVSVRAPSVAAWTSLPVGVVTLAERHGGHHVTPESFAGMVEEVACMIDAFPARAAVAAAARSRPFHLLGTSGTVTTVAGVHLGLRRYDRRRVDGLWMRDDDVSDVVERLLALSFAERVQNPCIGLDRADLVLAGCAILEAIRDAFPASRLRVADRGLREGILVEMMRADGTLGRDLEAPGLRPGDRRRRRRRRRPQVAGDPA